MNPFHKTIIHPDGSWSCTCGISGHEASEGIAISNALDHSKRACHHCTQPFGVCQPDCPNPDGRAQFVAHSEDPEQTSGGIDYEGNRRRNEAAGLTCMCDGGGSIMHVPSGSCTVGVNSPDPDRWRSRKTAGDLRDIAHPERSIRRFKAAAAIERVLQRFTATPSRNRWR